MCATYSLTAFGHLGVTDYHDEALMLFERGLKGGRQWSGGIYMMTLVHYLFDCARNGTGSTRDIKALVRANWAKLPTKGGFDFLYVQMLPGIDDDSVPLAEILDPRVWSRWERP
jgi:hypothetical protein